MADARDRDGRGACRYVRGTALMLLQTFLEMRQDLYAGTSASLATCVVCRPKGEVDRMSRDTHDLDMPTGATPARTQFPIITFILIYIHRFSEPSAM